MSLLAFYLMFGSAIECTGLLKRLPIGFSVTPALIGCTGVMLAGAIPLLWPLSGKAYPADCLLGPLGWPLAASVIAMLGAFVWVMRDYQRGTHRLETAVLAGWVAVYFGVGFSFWLALRLVGDSAWGLTLVVGVIVVTKFSDAGAYFAGRTWGSRKLCPMVSPGKTIEGLVGGTATAIVICFAYFGWFAPWLFGNASVRWHPAALVLLGAGLTLAGLVGDLTQSIVKREAGEKDSGKLLPGLGGLWDVTDSLLPTGVVGYLFVVSRLVEGPGQ